MRTLLAALIMAVTFAIIIVPAGPAGQSSTVSSVTVDQAQPAWGQPLSFTVVYPSAAKKDWPPRIYNPTLAVSCTGGWRAASFQASGQSKASNLGGGWWQSDLPVGAPIGSGAGTCSAWLEFTDGNGNTTLLASTQFPIG